MVPLALVTAMVMLAGWFPLTALWHQQSVISSTAAQIAAVKQQEQAFRLQNKSVSSASAETALAREQYQLVSPGQSLIQVLPGNGSGRVLQSTGDPGLQPLVSPSSAAPLGTNPNAKASVRDSWSKSFMARFVRTLEFWR